MISKDELKVKVNRIRAMLLQNDRYDAEIIWMALELVYRLLSGNRHPDNATKTPEDLMRLVSSIDSAIENGYDDKGECLFDAQKVEISLETAHRILL